MTAEKSLPVKNKAGKAKEDKPVNLEPAPVKLKAEKTTISNPSGNDPAVIPGYLNPEDLGAMDDIPEEQTEEEVYIELLEARLESLEEGMSTLFSALSKVTVLSGHGNHLREFGIDRWEPSQKDMTKY